MNITFLLLFLKLMIIFDIIFKSNSNISYLIVYVTNVQSKSPISKGDDKSILLIVNS